MSGGKCQEKSVHISATPMNQFSSWIRPINIDRKIPPTLPFMFNMLLSYRISAVTFVFQILKHTYTKTEACQCSIWKGLVVSIKRPLEFIKMPKLWTIRTSEILKLWMLPLTLWYLMLLLICTFTVVVGANW
jgi:hypothetical protein